MTKIAFILLFLLPFKVWSLELKVGDVLLQPLSCWSCNLIEAQEETIYSHMGVVIQVSPEVIVAEALTTVRSMPLDEFNSRTQKDQNLLVLRFKDQRIVKHLEDQKEILLAYYKEAFAGLKYDHNFLWDNVDENGDEKLYCSEFVTKLFSGFLGIHVPVKRMTFDKNREQWIRYFRGNPPDGKWGNSPATFEHSDLFYAIGEI